MHAHIERGIEDDKECENIFKDEFLQGMEKLRESIKERFEKNEQQFREDLQKDIKQLEYRIKDSLAHLERTNIDHGGFDFDLNIDTDSGIQGIGLAASVGSLVFGILDFWNPIGWAAIGLALVGVAKSVRKFFSSSYQRSQQKGAVDKSLNIICDSLTKGKKDKEGKEEIKGIDSQLEYAKKDAFEKIEKLKTLLNGPVDDFKRQKRQLEKANERLWDIEVSLMTSKQGAHNE